MQLKGAKLRSSKFGHVLVLETWPEAGKYLLGFQISPKERLSEVVNQIDLLLQVYQTMPITGIFSEQVNGLSSHASGGPKLSQAAQDSLNAECALRSLPGLCVYQVATVQPSISGGGLVQYYKTLSFFLFGGGGRGSQQGIKQTARPDQLDISGPAGSWAACSGIDAPPIMATCPP